MGQQDGEEDDQEEDLFDLQNRPDQVPPPPVQQHVRQPPRPLAGDDQVEGPAAAVDRGDEIEGGDGVVQQQDHVPPVRDAVGELLDSRVRPEIPGPALDVPADANGWGLIDKLGAWDCMLTQFATLEDVPAQHMEVWVEAFSQVLQKIEEAEDEQQLNRALKWFMLLPQGLLRKTTSRGGRAGRGQVARRFNAISRGDWGAVVEFWRADKVRLATEGQERGQRVRAENEDEEEMQKLRRIVVSLIGRGQVSKAVSRMNSFGVADSSDPAGRQQLQDKHPARSRELPRVERGQCVEGFGGLREDLKGLEDGVAPGTGGLRNEYLKILADKMSGEQMQLMEAFGMKYVNGELPEWFYVVWMTVQAIALYKNKDKEAVRPIGIRNPLAKSFNRQAMQQSKPDIARYLEPE